MEKKLYFILNMLYKQMNANLCRGFGMCPAIKNLSSLPRIVLCDFKEKIVQAGSILL